MPSQAPVRHRLPHEGRDIIKRLWFSVKGLGLIPVVPAHQRSRDLAVAVAFGKRVRELRLAAGMTQEALAEAAGLHPTFISNVERGYRVPSVPTMLRLAQGLEVAAGRLVEGVEG
ncbi:MAG TPA: helix-turn-helix transcriptional regulator [Acidimicrobiales bacterium]|nr:helix-turn-helix transcriptional regulator [Acidimicrobiales bacterium]